MVVTIFAKGIPAKDVAVDFGEQIVCSYPLFSEHLMREMYIFSLGLFLQALCRHDLLLLAVCS